MNQQEDRILHGLYYWREMINESIPITGDEILWLAAHKPSEHGTPKFQSLDRTQGPNDTHFKLRTTEQTRPIDYLVSHGYVRTNTRPGSTQTLEVTGKGAERARLYHTHYGRLNLWYRDRKEGIPGLLAPAGIAIITSVVTSLITTLVLHYVSR